MTDQGVKTLMMATKMEVCHKGDLLQMNDMSLYSYHKLYKQSLIFLKKNHVFICGFKEVFLNQNDLL